MSSDHFGAFVQAILQCTLDVELRVERLPLLVNVGDLIAMSGFVSVLERIDCVDVGRLYAILHRCAKLIPMGRSMAKKKRRKLSRAQARAEALRRKRQQRIIWAVSGVVVVAVIIVFVLIQLGGTESAELVEAQKLRDDIETGVTAEGYPYRGPADAPVTIVELSDYNCPICGDFTNNTSPLVDDELVATGQVRYVVQPFALWAESVPVVEAAICAREQGGFWEFHHVLFANQSLFSRARPPAGDLLRQFAEASGLNVDDFQACFNQGRRDEVEQSTRAAKDDLGVTGTPTFFVNGVRTQLSAGEAYIDTIRRAVQGAQAASPGE